MPIITARPFLGVRSRIKYATVAAPAPVVWVANGAPTQAVSGSSQNANRPAGTALNDFLLMVVQTQALVGTTGPNISTPAGWSRIGSAAPNSWLGAAQGTAADMFYKVASGAEPATWTVNSDIAAEWFIYVSRFTGNDPTTPLNAVSQASLIADASGNTIWNTPTVTPLTASCGIISIAVNQTASHLTYTAPGAVVKNLDDWYATANFQILMGNGIRATATPTGAIAWTHTGGATFPFFGATIAVKPKVG